jgi:TonB family protein
MALRLLLFSTDSDMALVLAKLLAESDLEVEFCSEMLASVEKVTRGNFDLIVVDWDDGAEATFLLKTARELKSTQECLAMALVSDAASAASAVQIGAHGILNKPIVPEQVKETLATIRKLIDSRQRDDGPAVASIMRPEAATRIQRIDPLEPPAEEPVDPTQPPAHARDPKLRFLSRKPRDLPSLRPLKETAVVPQLERQSGTLFSSLTQPAESPEPRERRATAKRYPRSGKRIAAAVVLLCAAALAYIWAPGSSYVERVGSLSRRIFSRKQAPQQSPQNGEETLAVPGVDSSDSAAGKTTQHAPALPGSEESSDDSSSDIQVIPVMNSSDSNSSTTTVAQPSGPEAPASPEAALGETTVAVAPAVSVGAAPSLSTSRQEPHPRRPSATVGQSPAQLPQSLNVSNPINPMQTAAAPVFSGALTPVVVPEETTKQLLLNQVPPSYPEEAVRVGLQGTVVLQAIIARDGSVRDVTLVRGPFVLARAAVEAVRQWQYKPYILNGQPVEAQTFVTVNFRLPASGSISGKPSAVSVPNQSPARP